MSVRIEIENQMNFFATTKLQDLMPAMLEPKMSQSAWESFKSKANQDFDIVNSANQGTRFIRIALFLILVMTGVLLFPGMRYFDDFVGILFIPFGVVMVGAMGLYCYTSVKTQAAMQALRNTCNNISQEIPGLTMHVMEEWVAFGRSGRGRKVYYITASVAGVNTGAVVLTVADTVENDASMPLFCPNCGTATNGNKFCGSCGRNLAA